MQAHSISKPQPCMWVWLCVWLIASSTTTNSLGLLHTEAIHIIPFIKGSSSVDFPSDAEKIQKVKLLVDSGHASQVLLSHAIHTKHRLVR